MLSRRSRGWLITFSGTDGAGKSTQIELLMDKLRRHGQNPIYLWARGGYTPAFTALKSLLRLLSRGRLVPQSGHSAQRSKAFAHKRMRCCWLYIALLDLLWVYGIKVRWWLWRSRTVVCDRFLWDTLIDFRLNFPKEKVETWRLWRLLVRLAAQPDVSFLLLVPVEESVRRSQLKHEPFPDAPEMLADRLAQYKFLAQDGFWLVLDGLRPIEHLANEICAAVFTHRRVTV